MIAVVQGDSEALKKKQAVHELATANRYVLVLFSSSTTLMIVVEKPYGQWRCAPDSDEYTYTSPVYPLLMHIYIAYTL